MTKNLSEEDKPISDKDENRMKKSQSVHFDVSEEQPTAPQSKITQYDTEVTNTDKAPDEPDAEKASTYMIRSETDEFQQIHRSHTINICDVAAESIKWLAIRLGPLLTAKHLSKNLIRMLGLCYLGEEQIVFFQEKGEYRYTSK